VQEYRHPVKEVIFSKNGLKSKDTIEILKSFNRHYAKMQELDLSSNLLGFEGSVELSKRVTDMK
jgi:hypothetical protein